MELSVLGVGLKLLPLWIVLGVLALVFLFGVVPTVIIAVLQFTRQLVRTNKKKWPRQCSWMSNAEQVDMYSRGMLWGEMNKEHCTDVEVISDGLKLAGQFFDYGFKKSVIIIPGRMECCTYSYYFAKPYPESGYNVLVIDNRAHGLSEGKYNCLGLKEYRDILEWGKLLHDKLGQEEVFIHGICIGSATAVQTLTSGSAPDYFTGMVADGMYLTFRETFKNHIIDLGHKTFPVLQEVMLLIKIFCGVDPVHHGPKYCIDKLDRPILMLYTRLDKFSRPCDAQYLYDKCNSPKRLVWFDKGSHSHIRINDEEGYDAAVKKFLADKDDISKLN